jgi:hypothetical protein
LIATGVIYERNGNERQRKGFHNIPQSEALEHPDVKLVVILAAHNATAAFGVLEPRKAEQHKTTQAPKRAEKGCAYFKQLFVGAGLIFLAALDLCGVTSCNP